MIKDSVWLSFMKDRYGYIDPESLADGNVVDLHKALMWKYTGDEMDKKSDEVGVFRDSLKPKQGRKGEGGMVLYNLPHSPQRGFCRPLLSRRQW